MEEFKLQAAKEKEVLLVCVFKDFLKKLTNIFSIEHLWESAIVKCKFTMFYIRANDTGGPGALPPPTLISQIISPSHFDVIFLHYFHVK